MLTIRNLHLRYEKEAEVLRGVNLTLEAGMTHGLVGLNGSGKTTLLNTLYAFLHPQEGALLWNNDPLRRKDIAYLEADNFFYTYMTGREYLRLFPAGAAAFPMDEWQQLFALPLDEVTETYSTGMKKRLALLAVIKQDKPILILDEPFNGLDLEGAHLLLLILDRLHARGKTILITSHIFETLTGCCQYIHHLHEGVIARSYNRYAFHVLQANLRQTVEDRSRQALDGLL